MFIKIILILLTILYISSETFKGGYTEFDTSIINIKNNPKLWVDSFPTKIPNNITHYWENIIK